MTQSNHTPTPFQPILDKTNRRADCCRVGEHSWSTDDENVYGPKWCGYCGIPQSQYRAALAKAKVAA